MTGSSTINKREQAGVQSLESGLKLMLVIAHHRRPMKLTAVAEQAAVSPGKAHRYLVSFIRAGFVTQDTDTGLYGMGPVALEFSLSCLATIEPISLATHEAERLCAETGHTVAVSVWGSFGPTVVRWEQPAKPVMVNVGLGSVFPLHRSATGRAWPARVT
jgi:DNA-binding IclR family transcriptional regulator